MITSSTRMIISATMMRNTIPITTKPITMQGPEDTSSESAIIVPLSVAVVVSGVGAVSALLVVADAAAGVVAGFATLVVVAVVFVSGVVPMSSLLVVAVAVVVVVAAAVVVSPMTVMM